MAAPVAGSAYYAPDGTLYVYDPVSGRYLPQEGGGARAAAPPPPGLPAGLGLPVAAPPAAAPAPRAAAPAPVPPPEAAPAAAPPALTYPTPRLAAPPPSGPPPGPPAFADAPAGMPRAWGIPAGPPAGGGPVARGPGGVAAGRGRAYGPDGQTANPGYAAANGVAAGPGMVDARRPESPVDPRVGGPAGGGGSGGGGDGGDFARAMRERLLGGLMGGGGGWTDYGDAYRGPSEADYRRADRRYERDQDRLEREYGLREDFSALLSNPAWALPGAARGVGSPHYARQAATPAAMLALIRDGSRGADRFSTDPRRFRRSVADLYAAMETETGALDFEHLMNRLLDPAPNSSLARLFQRQKEGKVVTDKHDLYKRTREGRWVNAPVEQQTSALLGGLGAVYDRTLAPNAAAAYMATAQELADAWAAKNLGKKKPGSILTFAGRRLEQ